MNSPGVCSPLDWCIALDYILKGLPLLLVVVGWALVNEQNNNRETRKELRKAADEAKALVRDLYKIAHKYYTHADAAIAFQIKDQLDELETELRRLPAYQADEAAGSKLLHAYNDYADAITDDPFESAKLSPLLPDDETIKRISRAKQALLMHIEEGCATKGASQTFREWIGEIDVLK